MKKVYLKLFLFSVIAGLLTFQPVEAQKKSKKKKGADTEAAKPEKKKDPFKTIEEVTKSSKLVDGLFNIYQDTLTGKLLMKVTSEQLGKEYIHFAHVLNGVGDAGFFTGQYGGSRIFTINRYYKNIEIQLENTRYYFDEENPLSRAAKANINTPIIFNTSIEASNKDQTEFLIDASSLFLSESFIQIKPSANPAQRPDQFTIGSLSKSKSKVKAIKNYPENTDLVTTLVYDSKYPRVSGSAAVTDGRAVSIEVQHSLIEVPDNDFEPRMDDPRIGYFTRMVDDQTSYEFANYRDMIHRWHLVKKDPDAALSEPVEPITWWIENTTPIEVREFIRDGVLQWNKAFETAGFKNAIVVKQQPDDAEWDAGDIRYNVLRWTSSPSPRFGGYGPSFVNPRTGQILGADVMLEYSSITFSFHREILFDIAGLGLETESYTALEEPYFCSHADFMHNQMLFGNFAMTAMDYTVEDKSEFLKEFIYMLTLHEVGHTLGLNHNMKASNLHSPDNINDKKLTLEKGLTGSVMDYSNVNISLDKSNQGYYWDIVPGTYDHWVINYGYSQTDEAGLKAILNQPSGPETYFGNDADDMRAPGRHIDPRVMIGDMTSDPVRFAADRIALVNSIYPKLLDKYSTEGENYNELRIAFLVLTGQYAISTRVMTRQIGGIYVDRSYIGQEGGTKPFTAVPYETQKNAMKALNKYAFSPGAFDFPKELYSYLQRQRRGFTGFGQNEDPHLHDRYLRIHNDLLNQLTHPNVLKRITDSQMYGNKYSLSEMMTDLTNAIFEADLNRSVNSIRQNLQQEYTDRLISVVGEKSSYDNASKSMAFYELKRINRMVKASGSPNTSTRAHRQFIVHKIETALENN